MITYIILGIVCFGLGWVFCSIYHYNHWVNRVIGSLMAYGSGKKEARKGDSMPQNYPKRTNDGRINQTTRDRMIALKNKILSKVKKP